MKRILNILLCICAISILPLSAYAQKNESSDRVVLAKELIKALSEDYVFAEDSEQTVTRGEFVFALMEALGQKGTDSSFDDVPEKHFANRHIAALENMGLTQQSSMFYPDRAMTWQNAAEMAVTALGYKEKAEYYGGYPSGYLRVANELKIDKGMKGKQMTVDNAVMAIFNIINAYPLEMASVKNGAIAYTPSDDTLLYKYRKITYTEGIVTADEASGLTNSNNTVDKGCVVINDTVFYGVEESGLLGKNCAVYYTDAVKNSVVCISEYNNDIEKLDIRLYNTIDSQNLEYDKGTGATGRIRLDGSYNVLYNRKAAKSLDADSYVDGAESGFVEVIDNNGDGRYDIISITAYEYAWVSGIDLLNRVIYDRVSKKNIELSDDDISLTVKALSEGVVTTTDLSEISAGSLIAYAESEDKKAYDIVLCYDTKELTITAVSTDEDEFMAVADSVEYNMNSFIYNFTQNPIGLSGSFFLGVNGELAALMGYGRSMIYGYVYRVGEDSEDLRPYIKVISDKGLETFKIAEDVNVDGERKKCDDIWNDLKNDITVDEKMRVIRYKLKNNEITAIDTADTVTAIDSFNEIGDSDDSLAAYYEGELYYASNGGFLPYFNIGASTVIFVIPQGEDANDVSKYRVEYPNYFIDNITHNVIAYDIGTNSTAGAVVAVDQPGAIGLDITSAVVSKIERTINEDDEPILAVTLWENGVFNQYYTRHDCTGDVDVIEKGDIIRYGKSGEDIVYILIDYNMSDTVFGDGLNSLRGRNEYFRGTVFSLSGGNAYVYHGNGSPELPVNFTDLRLTRINGVPTVLVENNNGVIEVKNISPDAVRDFLSSGNESDSIVCRQRYYVPQLNVIYRTGRD